MKKIILIILTFFFSYICCYSQSVTLNRDASYKQYGQYIHFYLKSQHEFIYKGELDSLNEQFFFIVSFKIDVNGNIVEYETENKEGYIPIAVSNYIKKVIYLTSGEWQPEIENCSLVKSKKILCKVIVSPTNFFNNKLKEYGTKPLTMEDFKIKNSPQLNFNEPNRCFLHLSY